jgi:hypothetical protein
MSEGTTMLRLKTLLPLAALLSAAAIAAPPAVKPAGGLIAVAFAKSTHFTLTASTTVSYGNGEVWTQKDLGKGIYRCGPDTFGLASSVATGGEQCRYTRKGGGLVVVAPPVVVPTPAPALVKIAAEFASFNLSAPTIVTYGLNGKTVGKALPAGTHTCGNETFGSDPLPTVAKECTAPATATEVSPSKPADPVVVAPAPSTGASIREPSEYRRVAALMGTQAGMDYLYGQASSKVLTNLYPSVPASKPMNMVSIQNPNGLGNRGCSWTGWCGTSQFGELEYASGDYSSSVANFGYIPFAVPDRTIFKANRYWGIGAIQQISVAHSTFSVVPEPSWTVYEGETRNNAHNEEQLMRQIEGTAAPGTNGKDIFEGKPVACARGYGRGGWINNVLCVQSNGSITSHGSNTSRNNMLVRLPAGAGTPTAISVTNSGEFAFVTTWDTVALRGKIWTIGLKDACQDCRPEDESKWTANWGQWNRVYVGLPNLGNYVGGKVLGPVDLPEDIIAPTAISVTTGRSSERHDGYETVMRLWDEPIDAASQRARYFGGDFKNAIANTGMAVVISKGEKRAAFVDLKPLFTQARQNWLASMSDDEFKSRVAARGDGDSQFPKGFASLPSQKPVVIKTMAFESAPTSLRTMLTAPFRSVIGTEDGNLHVVDLGANYLNQTNAAAVSGSPSDIKELSTFNVGGNPTSIAFVKGKSSQRPDGRRALWGYEKDDSFLWAVSREEKKASMIQWNADRTAFSGAYLAVQDARISDPIVIEDADNHGTESYVATIGSGSSLFNVLYGPIIAYTYKDAKKPFCQPDAPCGPITPKSIMFGGEFKVPGNVFYVGGGNIN